MSKSTRLATLWCPVCKKMTMHRIGPIGEPRCLICEEETVSLPPLPPKERRIEYPL